MLRLAARYPGAIACVTVLALTYGVFVAMAAASPIMQDSPTGATGHTDLAPASGPSDLSGIGLGSTLDGTTNGASGPNLPQLTPLPPPIGDRALEGVAGTPSTTPAALPPLSNKAFSANSNDLAGVTDNASMFDSQWTERPQSPISGQSQSGTSVSVLMISAGAVLGVAMLWFFAHGRKMRIFEQRRRNRARRNMIFNMRQKMPAAPPARPQRAWHRPHSRSAPWQ